MSGTELTITATNNGAETIYSKTISLDDSAVTSVYDWFFEPFVQKKDHFEIDFPEAVTQIINLIESVIPEEIDVKSKYETDDDGGIIVVVDENNNTMTGENLVHLARLASDEGYNQAIKDIKSKLIGKE